MKQRQTAIIEDIANKHITVLDDLLDKYKISKRTLYYDIEDINYFIRDFGQIKRIDKAYLYIGDLAKLIDFLSINKDSENIKQRRRFLQYKILNNQLTLDLLIEQLGVSKNTILTDIEEINKKLVKDNLQIELKKHYEIVGDELKIRDLFLQLLFNDDNLLNYRDSELEKAINKHNSHLSDYSKALLIRFVWFLNSRIKISKILSRDITNNEYQKLDYQGLARDLLCTDDINEISYLTAYLSTLSKVSKQNEVSLIDSYAQKLANKFEAFTANQIINLDEFKNNIKQHLLSSYYRIKYNFPSYNPLLKEIKTKYTDLFEITKQVMTNSDEFPDFKGIREEEIAYITIYFGGHLELVKSNLAKDSRVLIVCPNGLMISKTIENQLYQYIPNINIVGSLALSELSNWHEGYDLIISTLPIPGYPNVIVVRPLLRDIDIEIISKRIIREKSTPGVYERILEVIKENCEIKDLKKLEERLVTILYGVSKEGVSQPMLKDLINDNRIVCGAKVNNWQEAITLAAQPLIIDGSITNEYIDAMIESVNKHGPYIVLADYFALPHASSASGVNKLAMSLLVLDEEVDLLGNSVKIFMVLATVDSTSHMKALASLSKLLYDKDNFNIFMAGNKEEIINLIESVKE